MKAVRIHRYGGPEVLQYEEAPIPEPREGEVRVRVHATSINPVDWKVREGFLKDAVPHKLPLVLGWDVSGTVDAVGPGARDFRPGDEVFSRPDIARDGAYAQYIIVREKELARKPRNLDHAHSAAVPLAGLTAWQSLFEAPPPFTAANLEQGQSVLIHAAAGGVGTFAVQLARWKGASRIVATASSRNESFLRELGADQVIDYNRERFEDVAGEVDVVLDTMGGDTQARSWKVVRPGGVLVSIVQKPSEALAKERGARAAYVFVQPSRPQLAELAQLLDARQIKACVSEILPLAEARKAQEKSQSGHVRGKVVLSVTS